jgi:hypothetical protein
MNHYHMWKHCQLEYVVVFQAGAEYSMYILCEGAFAQLVWTKKKSVSMEGHAIITPISHKRKRGHEKQASSEIKQLN